MALYILSELTHNDKVKEEKDIQEMLTHTRES